MSKRGDKERDAAGREDRREDAGEAAERAVSIHEHAAIVHERAATTHERAAALHDEAAALADEHERHVANGWDPSAKHEEA